MANWRQCSMSLVVFLSCFNLASGVDFSSSNIARLSYIAFICSFIISLAIIEKLLGLFCLLRPACIYREYVDHLYTLSQCGLRIQYARLRFQRIIGGCRI